MDGELNQEFGRLESPGDTSINNTDVVILSGGLGTRLRSVVNDRPKVMAEIAGQPFLDILLSYVSGYGFKRFVLCLGHRGDFIKEYYNKKHRRQEIVFSYEDAPLGTGGAVKNAERVIQSSPFLVMNGDSFCEADLLNFVDFHLKKKADLSMVVVNDKNDGNKGSVFMDDSNRIVNFAEKEKGAATFVNAGIYCVEKAILSLIPNNRQYSLEHDLFPNLAGNKSYAFIAHQRLIDIGTPENYSKANSWIFQKTIPKNG